MPSRRLSKSSITQNVKDALAREPGLTIMELADRAGVNRQFMAGFLAALEERGEVSCRKVGPARIYFNVTEESGQARSALPRQANGAVTCLAVPRDSWGGAMLYCVA